MEQVEIKKTVKSAITSTIKEEVYSYLKDNNYNIRYIKDDVYKRLIERDILKKTNYMKSIVSISKNVGVKEYLNSKYEEVIDGIIYEVGDINSILIYNCTCLLLGVKPKFLKYNLSYQRETLKNKELLAEQGTEVLFIELFPKGRTAFNYIASKYVVDVDGNLFETVIEDGKVMIIDSSGEKVDIKDLKISCKIKTRLSEEEYELRQRLIFGDKMKYITDNNGVNSYIN